MEITPEMIARQSAEAQEMILFLLATIQRLEQRIVQLENEVDSLREQLGKNPRNSSLPPSTEHPHAKPAADSQADADQKSTKKHKRKRGGQKGHKKHKRELVPVDEVDVLVPLHPTHCRRCGEVLTGDDPNPLRHQVWELPEIKPLITEYQRHRITCECCKTSTCASLPDGVSESQAGPGLTAFAAILMACFRQSKRQTELCQ